MFQYCRKVLCPVMESPLYPPGPQGSSTPPLNDNEYKDSPINALRVQIAISISALLFIMVFAIVSVVLMRKLCVKAEVNEDDSV